MSCKQGVWVVACMVCVLSGWVTGASAPGPRDMTIRNGSLRIEWNAEHKTFSVSEGPVRFIEEARIPEATSAETETFGGRFGTGRALIINSANGDRTMLALYDGVPFVMVRRDVTAGPAGRTIETLDVIDWTVPEDLCGAEWRLLGCDGLTDTGRDRTVHCFLAMGHSKQHRGLVAGWLTHHSGSGVVTSRPTGSTTESGGTVEPADRARRSPVGLTMGARTEYGRWAMGPDQRGRGETFVIGWFEDALDGLERYAELIAVANDVRLKHVPSGYCTWYSRPHGGASDEKHIAELAAFCGEHLVPFGFEVIQIDDHWQISRRDFTTHKPNGPYPSGMRATAETIRKAGMVPGIWYIPFGWDPKRPVFADHQDWFVKRRDTGELYTVRWAGTCLDMTHPGARGLLEGVVSRMSRQWGYGYMKIDGLWTGLAAKITYPDPRHRPDGLGDAVFHDPRRTNIEAYRAGLKLVRRAAGPDVFILGCNIAQNMRTLGASFGLVDGMRVGRDIGAQWDRILPCVDMGSRLYFLHGRVWANDPDCLMLREPLTLEQARAWGSWIGITGQLNMVSEWLPGLPAERLEVVKRTMPNHQLCARPIDLFAQPRARIWRLTDTRAGVRRDVIGLFNWDTEQAQTIAASADELGLPPSPTGRYVAFDYWAGRFVGPIGPASADGTLLTIDVPAGACRVLAVRPLLDRPLLLSTSRHVSQGIVDVMEEDWDPEGGVLSGRSRVVGNDPYELRIVLPDGWRVAEVFLDPENAGVPRIRHEVGGARITWTCERNRPVGWRLHCVRSQ